MVTGTKKGGGGGKRRKKKKHISKREGGWGAEPFWKVIPSESNTKNTKGSDGGKE